MLSELKSNKQPQLSQKLIDEISSFAKIRNIEKVILFGSRARGDNRRTSDIDLAVRGGDVLGFRFDVDEMAQNFDIIYNSIIIKQEF